MDVFMIAIHGPGYRLPGGYDELPAYLCTTMRAPVWEYGFGSSNFPVDDLLALESQRRYENVGHNKYARFISTFSSNG
jgi:hypothetical protein